MLVVGEVVFWKHGFSYRWPVRGAPSKDEAFDGDDDDLSHGANDRGAREKKREGKEGGGGEEREGRKRGGKERVQESSTVTVAV